ncbi:dethiobiotin synthase [Bacillus solimangrovi]|uniref:ATP-dependent dethiobiotin synthetase BioD n=1 Tax=Bacillus solimangrovi TaxID=1305675 RepID=A0A1E5LB46_9BACI|nr:dethiobiotin synthase [Bacillus solimangrovi]OEH91311.1 dethiobiotin synthase [Bacillus solimangrovi]
MSSYFITGTDTDVGKTIATTLLTLYFKHKDKNVFPYKPIQSGAIEHNGEQTAPDVLCYTQALPSLNSNSAYTYLLNKPYSPHLAAKEEQTTIQIDRIRTHISQLKQNYDHVLVEGAGGVMVPIHEDGYDMRSLMKDLALPVIVVARAGLGTINHTLLSIMALEQANIPIAGILLNELEQDSDQTINDDNYKMIEKLSGKPIIGVIPYMTDIELAFQQTELLEPLFKSFDKHLLEGVTNK